MRFYLLVIVWIILAPFKGNCDSWQEAKVTKTATLDLYWYTTTPFVYRNSEQKLVGLEVEIFDRFKQYVKKQYQIDLELNWVESESFPKMIDTIRYASNPNRIGASALSMTEERRTHFGCTNAYLPDITVLVSSQGTPIVQNFDEIHNMMKDMQAITIKSTLYETLLLKMKGQIMVDFDIVYTDSDQDILDRISGAEKMIGFIDLPIYMRWIKAGKNLTRQNFFTVKGKGYGFILPPSSDWHEPINEFLAAEHDEFATIISGYMGDELFKFIDESYGREELGTYILTREKEIQLELIKNANLKLEQEKYYKHMLVFGLVAITIFLLTLLYFYRKSQKNTRLLLTQKNKIESQQKDIGLKNEQLLNRNAQLLALNEDKNNLISILAHDLRSPLGNIIGLSQLLTSQSDTRSAEDVGYLDKINGAANQMNQMILKILDAGTLDKNQNTPLKEPVNVNQLIQDLVARYQLQATNKNIVIEMTLPEQHRSIETDHLLLFLILENLLSNAVKFSPHGSIVTVAAKYEENRVIFSITDKGPGFTEEDKANIFSRFQRLSAKPTGNETSTGLGLSIVKKYVSDLNGKVWLESEPGKGSTFFVSLESDIKDLISA